MRPFAHEDEAGKLDRVQAARAGLSARVGDRPWCVSIGHTWLASGDPAVEITMRWFDPFVAKQIVALSDVMELDVPMVVRVVTPAPSEALATPIATGAASRAHPFVQPRWRENGVTRRGARIFRHTITGEVMTIDHPGNPGSSARNGSEMAHPFGAPINDVSQVGEALVFWLGYFFSYRSWKLLHNMALSVG